MEEENKITETPNNNFDEELDKYDQDHVEEQEDESKADEVQLKPKKEKKPRTAKQIAAFEKAQITRKKNIAARKAKKTPPILSDSEDEQLEPIEVKKKATKSKKLPKRQAKKKVVYQEPTSSDSSDEEVIAVVKRRKKPKAKKKPAPKIIYEDDLDSSSDDNDDHGGHYINVPVQPQLYIA